MWLTNVLSAAIRGTSRSGFKKYNMKFQNKEQWSPHKYWTRRRLFMMTAHFWGRRRNVYRISVLYHIKDLQRTTQARPASQKDFRELCDARIEAAAGELNYDSWTMREALARSHVHLNRKVLANLAIFEPRSFRSIVAVSANKVMQSPEQDGLGMPQCGPGTDVITRGRV